MLGLQSRVAQQQCSSSAHRQQRHAHRRVPLSKPLHASLDSKPELKRPAPAPPAPQQPEAAAAAPAGSAAAAPEAPRPAPTVAAGGKTSTTTIEYQRQQAKAMAAYYTGSIVQRQLKDTTVFGWTRKNEINNGRWVMFGWAVGLLTELATGVDFPHQLSLMASYLGVLDLD